MDTGPSAGRIRRRARPRVAAARAERHGVRLDDFAPRHVALAKRVLFALTTVAGGVTIVFTAVIPTEQTRTASTLSIVASLAMIAIATSLAVVSAPPRWVWAAYPFAAVAAIAVLDLASSDASVTALVFFFFPVLYAGAQLRRAAAATVTGASVGAVAVVTSWLLTPGQAAVQTTFVGAALVAVAWLLVVSQERNDTLIDQLERQAAVDPLTGLMTRRVLDSAVTSALGSAGHDGGTALLLIDLDHFKSINDVHGHPTGDFALQELARLLRTVNRETDLISRMGGDEIAVLMPGCDLVTALDRAELILLEVRAARIDVAHVTLTSGPEAETTLTCTVSIGVAHLPTHATDLRALYGAADASLYRAKRAGRDGVGAVDGETERVVVGGRTAVAGNTIATVVPWAN